MAWSKMTSLELSDEDKLDTMCPPGIADAPDYPWGTRITLTHRELDKLGLEADCAIGDVIDLRCFARVTGVNRTETQMGPEDRVELQITDMAVENETEEEVGG